MNLPPPLLPCRHTAFSLRLNHISQAGQAEVRPLSNVLCQKPAPPSPRQYPNTPGRTVISLGASEYWFLFASRCSLRRASAPSIVFTAPSHQGSNGGGSEKLEAPCNPFVLNRPGYMNCAA